MFPLTLKRVFFACDKVFVRNIRQKRLPPNPGLDYRIHAFKEKGLPLDEDVEEYLQESESDFRNVDQAHKLHEQEQRLQGEALKRLIVKQKYFKEVMPNLLTWSEKEQIRYLHSTYPEEWTFEKIAESFPVTAAIAKKLVKYPWKPATEQRIARHDENAMRNWKELKEGTLEIPAELREHFLKFSDRTIPPLSKKSIKIDITQNEKMGEFQAIIDKCAAKEKSQENLEENGFTTSEFATNDTTNLNKNKIDKKRITLEELTNKIKASMKSGKSVDLPDQLIVNTFDLNTVTTKQDPSSDVDLSNEKEKSMTHWESDEKKNEIVPYPDRIRIPKSAWKRGATYKVDDCYYDDDGRFLYRVIGMKD